MPSARSSLVRLTPGVRLSMAPFASSKLCHGLWISARDLGSSVLQPPARAAHASSSTITRLEAMNPR